MLFASKNCRSRATSDGGASPLFTTFARAPNLAADGGDDTPKILALYMVLFFSKKNNASEMLKYNYNLIILDIIYI